eukprot:scaffold60604_cov57-Phaeocystis_antarctica.AAC.3
MLVLLGVTVPGVKRSSATPVGHGQALAADGIPQYLSGLSAFQSVTEDWTLEDRKECRAGHRGAAKEECLAAIKKAAHKRGYGGAETISLKVADRALVPPGCSYSINSKTALFNENPGGWQKSGNFRVACLATRRPHRVILLSRGRGGSTVLATTLAAFGHSDPEKLHHELFGGNAKEMRKLENPTRKMEDYFREMEKEQPMAGVVGFKWKPYDMGDGSSRYGSAWDWVAEHNVSVVWMTRNILDVLISNHKHCGDHPCKDDSVHIAAHCQHGDEKCIAEHRDVKVTLDASTLLAELEHSEERYETNLSRSMNHKGVNFIKVMFEHLFVGDEDFSEGDTTNRTSLFVRSQLDSTAYDASAWRPDPLAAWNRILSFVGVEPVEDYSTIQRVATLEYERTDARTNCDSIENLEHVRSALAGTKYQGLLGC